ncbi:leucine-rich repeat-containing protein 74B [Nematostella vectensis]|uniref:leucine-rich repeat-containing protein 74B n=1 Tax=Nematostella vectensis TaxID=45351 RepID=UPI00207748B6|nr:leucine-rich repeat-containing protein 74B [Nematostella vectensis]
MQRRKGSQNSQYSGQSKPRSCAHAVRSACSSASNTIKKVENTIQALQGDTLADLDETLSNSSSHWDTDLEDSSEDEDLPLNVKNEKDYKKICNDLGVIPVSRFGKEIGAEEVKINHRYLRALGTKAVASILRSTDSTSKVQMSFNDLSAKGSVYMGKVLVSNKSLKELDLANNNIRKEGVSAISNALVENTVIRRLDLSGNGLTDKDAKILADAIGNNSTLRYLNLSYNKFGEKAGEVIGAALSYNNGITELNLSWNQIRRRGAQGIHRSLRVNDTLEMLDLSWNGFDDFGTEDLMEALEHNTSLIVLNLSNNRLTDRGILNIANGLNGNTTLEELNLNRNPALNGDRGVTKLAENIKKKQCALMNLKIVDVRIGSDCVKLLKQCLSENEMLNIDYGCKKKDTFSSKKAEINPFEFLKEYLDKHKIHSSDLFKRLDENEQFRDSLTRAEFTEGMKRLKVMNDYYLDKLVEMLDTDGDGEIDYSEFVKMS